MRLQLRELHGRRRGEESRHPQDACKQEHESECAKEKAVQERGG